MVYERERWSNTLYVVDGLVLLLNYDYYLLFLFLYRLRYEIVIGHVEILPPVHPSVPRFYCCCCCCSCFYCFCSDVFSCLSFRFTAIIYKDAAASAVCMSADCCYRYEQLWPTTHTRTVYIRTLEHSHSQLIQSVKPLPSTTAKDGYEDQQI